MTVLVFFASAIAIYVACGYFVNGIEWVGRTCGIGETATGTVLAAFGTALPESAVTFVAVTFNASAAQKEIGVGAALGGPLVLSTLSYAMVGFVLWLNARKLHRKNEQIHTDQKRLSRDQAWFLSIFAFKIGLGMVAFTGKSWLGLLFFAAYGLYVWREMLGDNKEENNTILEPLSLCPLRRTPPLFLILLQTIGALIVIAIASHFFVGEVEHIGVALGMAPQLVALLLSPIATELPETMNAIIWVRQGKERLALANISGAMMIQATIPSALGLLFTTWILTTPLLIAGAVTALAIIALFLIFRKGRVSAKQLMSVSLGYIFFLIALMLA